MTYEQFKTEVCRSMEAKFPDKSIMLMPVTKNNGKNLDGICIKDSEINISPTIYLNYFFEEYTRGKSFDETIDELILVYNQNKMETNVDLEFFYDFNQIKENITFKLINKERNRKLLETVPFIEVLDFAVVFNYAFPARIADEVQATILIKNNFLELWGIDAEELYKLACENTQRIFGLKIENIFDAVKRFLRRDEMFFDEKDFLPIYVVSNRKMINGACVVLYQDFLKNFANQVESDFYIIPCSVHEVLMMPINSELNLKVTEIKDMISFVNKNEVSESDFLSDNLYYYDRLSDEIKICC